MPQVNISGTEFLLDNQPTYPSRQYEGHSIQGMLFNVRAVQATFDDANPTTQSHWTYPDTGHWDPDRNVTEFCAALPLWQDHGVLAFTINFQGGGPLYVPEIYQHYDNNGFTPAGELKPAYADRMARVLARADELGMVVIVGLFYWVFLLKMKNIEAIWRAADEALTFLKDTGHRNLLIEIANEIDVVMDHLDYSIFAPDRIHQMIEKLRADHPHFLYSTSGGGIEIDTGRGLPSPALVETADFVLIHGNGTRPPQLEAGIKTIKAMPAYQKSPKPIVINEDSPAVANMEVAWRHGVSWGYYDQGWDGQSNDPYEWYEPLPRKNEEPFETLSGFQTPPVNWTINTPFKCAFFNRVAEITGYPG
jgi:hypothetical protein